MSAQPNTNTATETKEQKEARIKKEQATYMSGAMKKYGTKSAIVRALTAEGMTRGDIMRKTGIRYQHVRNILVTPVKTPKVAGEQAQQAA